MKIVHEVQETKKSGKSGNTLVLQPVLKPGIFLFILHSAATCMAVCLLFVFLLEYNLCTTTYHR